VLRAAVLGRQGRVREAGTALAELLQVKPDFSSQARWLIGCYVKFEELADRLLEGLGMAGLMV
jgi:hypothetical protein